MPQDPKFKPGYQIEVALDATGPTTESLETESAARARFFEAFHALSTDPALALSFDLKLKRHGAVVIESTPEQRAATLQAAREALGA